MAEGSSAGPRTRCWRITARECCGPASRIRCCHSRLPLVYLFHRYALAAAINVVGSAKVPLSLAGDGQEPVIIWPAESQKEALRLRLRHLSPAQLECFCGSVEGAGSAGESRRGSGALQFVSGISFQSAGWSARRGGNRSGRIA